MMRPLQLVCLLAAGCLFPQLRRALGWVPLRQALLVTAACPAAFKPSQYQCLQILYNIVGNALKFTSAGTVSVLVKPTADMKSVVFTVADTGIGIPEKNFASIFLPFEQVRRLRCFGGSELLACLLDVLQAQHRRVWWRCYLLMILTAGAHSEQEWLHLAVLLASHWCLLPAAGHVPHQDVSWHWPGAEHLQGAGGGARRDHCCLIKGWRGVHLHLHAPGGASPAAQHTRGWQAVQRWEPAAQA